MAWFHPSISPSPVYASFSHIEWNAPVAISKPEQALLQSAEENPLEYTLAEYEDAFAYARLLLKVLDQVTGPSNPGSVSQLPLECQSENKTPYLDVEEALDYLAQDKTGVVTHYVITQLYDIMGLLLERPANSPIQISTIFYQNHRLLEDWRPLLRILYRPGDAFAQRGAALCLAYILQAGLELSSSGSVNLLDGATTAEKVPMVEETLQSLVSWLTSRLQSSHHRHHATMSLGVVTPTLVVLSSCPPARIIFDNAGGIGYLARHLRPSPKSHRKNTDNSRPTTPAVAPLDQSIPQQSSTTSTIRSRRPNGTSPKSNTLTLSTGVSTTSSSPSPRKAQTWTYSNASVQQLYELCFCLWTMTYECFANEAIRQHFHRDGAVGALSDLLAAAPREKVVRLTLSSLRNLATVDKSFVHEMVGFKVFRTVDRLLTDRRWSDPDIVEDLEALHDILHEHYKELSKWEVYQAELDTGQLKWGILHSESFFKANIRRMEGERGDFAPVKRLIHLIRLNAANTSRSSRSPSLEDIDMANSSDNNGGELEDDEQLTTLSIAIFDLGEFVRRYPNGKSIASKFGAKVAVMPLIDHHHPQVQRQALQCISKLLLADWHVVGKDDAS